MTYINLYIISSCLASNQCLPTAAIKQLSEVIWLSCIIWRHQFALWMAATLPLLMHTHFDWFGLFTLEPLSHLNIHQLQAILFDIELIIINNNLNTIADWTVWNIYSERFNQSSLYACIHVNWWLDGSIRGRNTHGWHGETWTLATVIHSSTKWYFYKYTLNSWFITSLYIDQLNFATAYSIR